MFLIGVGIKLGLFQNNSGLKYDIMPEFVHIDKLTTENLATRNNTKLIVPYIKKLYLYQKCLVVSNIDQQVFR